MGYRPSSSGRKRTKEGHTNPIQGHLHCTVKAAAHLGSLCALHLSPTDTSSSQSPRCHRHGSEARDPHPADPGTEGRSVRDQY
jgi:hypothetical protein